MSAVPSFSFARRHGIVAAPTHGPEVWFIREDTSLAAVAEVCRLLGHEPQWQRVSDEAFAQALAQCYSAGQDGAARVAEGMDEDLDLLGIADQLPGISDLLEQDGDAPIIRLINALLSEAVRAKASDIHLETYEHALVIRMRVDGELREILRQRRELAALMVSRIKVMARLDIAEKRIPQDGRMSLRLAGHEVDVRVSTLPSVQGERVVLRLLDKQAGRFDLQGLGMSAATLQGLRGIVNRSHGIFLVTGPTGSGKSTSLYAALLSLDVASRNILTIEDPVEYHLPGIGQTPVNSKVDMTFARGLRAILRQDPDVVMVGEIRDTETAEMAVQASLTGHLVLSTLHTNSAVGAVTRLLDMGVDAYLLASSLVGVLAQRLVRVLCQHCRLPVTASAEQCRRLDVDPGQPPTLYRAVGCAHCQAGYKGRTGLYELVVCDAAMARLIHARASEAQLWDQARQASASLFEDGRRRVLEGCTTLDEVLRASQED